MKYLIINIAAKEPLKLTNNGLDTTLKSISGSMIKGAFLRELAGGKKLQSGDENYEKLQEFLKTKELFFYDGYLKVKNNNTFPVPLCFLANKHKLKEFSKNESLKVKNVFFNESKSDDVNLDKFDYGFITKNQNHEKKEKLEIYSVDTIENIHITKKMEEGNIFRYEAIEKGQNFYSVVKGQKEYLEIVKEKLYDRTVYLGGSKGTGYGKVTLKLGEIKELKNLKEELNLKEENNLNSLIVYFYTKSLIKDNFGNTVGTIPTEFLEEKLGIKNVKLKDQIVKTFQVSGYNRTWNAVLPKDLAIKEGSIMKFSYEGNLSNAKVEELENFGIGYMRDRGFGQILINPDFSKIEEIIKKDKNENKDFKLEYKIIENNNYRNILKSLIENKEKKFIDRRIIDLNLSSAVKVNVLNNQIKKIIQSIENNFNINNIKDKDYMQDRKKINFFDLTLEKVLKNFNEVVADFTGEKNKQDYKRRDLLEMKKTIKEKELFKSDCKLAKEIFLGLLYYKTRNKKEVKEND